jgi:hypothetical protein
MDKNLIMGMAYNYDHEKIDIFVKSLRQYYDGKIVLVTGPLNDRMQKYFDDHNLISYEVDEEVNTSLLFFIRWNLYKHIIEEYFPDVENIILSDIRDVVFQDNPFDHLSGKDLDFSPEPEMLRNCTEHNAKWILEFYGQEELDKAGDNLIICAGFVGGTRKGILELSDLLVKEAEILAQSNKLNNYDQGSLNVLYARGCFPNSTMNHNFKTMHHSKTLTFDRRGYLLDENGKRVPVVHQYDRLGHMNIVFVKNALQIKGKSGVKLSADYVVKNFNEWDLD